MKFNEKDDGGRRAEYAHVKFNVKDDGGRKDEYAHVKFNVKADGGRKAGSAHVNPTTGGGRNPRFAPMTKPHDPFLAKFHPRH